MLLIMVPWSVNVVYSNEVRVFPQAFKISRLQDTIGLLLIFECGVLA